MVLDFFSAAKKFGHSKGFKTTITLCQYCLIHLKAGEIFYMCKKYYFLDLQIFYSNKSSCFISFSLTCEIFPETSEQVVIEIFTDIGKVLVCINGPDLNGVKHNLLYLLLWNCGKSESFLVWPIEITTYRILSISVTPLNIIQGKDYCA